MLELNEQTARPLSLQISEFYLGFIVSSNADYHK